VRLLKGETVRIGGSATPAGTESVRFGLLFD
jgi:hypothetical protein